jgi:hypothetical protein
MQDVLRQFGAGFHLSFQRDRPDCQACLLAAFSYYVHERTGLHLQKTTKALSNCDMKRLIASANRADVIGLPLNVFVTFHPRNTRDLTDKDRQTEFRRIINLYSQDSRDNGRKQAWLCVREVELQTGAEHMHMLCHVPVKRRASFIARVSGWGREPGACHARLANTKGHWSRQGYWFSDLLYMAKQMSPQAKFGRPYRRIAGAPILGARWGASRNIKQGKSGEG